VSRNVLGGLIVSAGAVIWLGALVATGFNVVVVSLGLLAMLYVLGRPSCTHASGRGHL
jgi:hypothetical protein